MKRVLLQPAYVLHRRPYRETSFLIDLFSLEYGRLSVIAKGVRKPRSALPGLLQPFVPLLISWAGKEELMTLSHIEPKGAVKNLVGDCLFAGFYINELLMCLLQKWDAHSKLFTIYEETLTALETSYLKQAVLRTFEKALLEELGYGILPTSESILQQTFNAQWFYRFIPEQGFVLEGEEFAQSKPMVFSGKNLIAMARNQWQEEGVLADAKRLIRFVLANILGQRSINSRKLFIQLNEMD